MEGGARFIQVRAKNASGQRLFDAAAAIVDRAREAAAVVIVNDRADIARMAGAGGVHVGQDDLPPQGVRIIVGDDAVVGLSTHTPEQAAAAVRQLISYLAIGPVFSTRTKATGYEPVGFDGVRDAATLASGLGLPLVAIGGITLASAPAVLEAGADAVAVISDLLSTGDPEAHVRKFLQVLPH